MRKNVKIIASLVRKAKRKLNQGKKDEALELMRKAVSADDNNGVLVEIIKVIGRKKTISELEDEPEEILEEILEDEPEEAQEEIPEIELSELEPVPETKVVENNKERNTSMASADQLTKLFEASDREYDNGHQLKAVAYLKRARVLDPENPEVQLKLDVLKSRIKSANLVQIARKKLESGEVARAVVLVRQAFNMRPDTTGLDELLTDLEDQSGIPFSASEESGAGGSASISSGDYITRIRQLVQDNSLEEAASVAEKAFEIFPEDDLVIEFVDNFKKLGLLE